MSKNPRKKNVKRGARMRTTKSIEGVEEITEESFEEEVGDDSEAMVETISRRVVSEEAENLKVVPNPLVSGKRGEGDLVRKENRQRTKFLGEIGSEMMSEYDGRTSARDSVG